MTYQKTSLERLLDKTIFAFANTWLISWKSISIALLSLLIGFYIGGNVTSFYLYKIGQRSTVVLIMIIFNEVIVNLVRRVNVKRIKLFMLALDNIRIGAIYAVILEAFKLGS